MKSLSWYILILLLLISIPTATVAIVDTINPLFGFVSMTIADLPEQIDIVEGCKCENGYVYSGDRQFKKICSCGENCKCPKTLQDKPKKPDGQSLKEGDCDILKSMYPVGSPYKKFLPKQKGKELWCLKVFTNEEGVNWCAPCKLMEYEFSKMKRTGWNIEDRGDMSVVGDFHIRLIDFEKFEGFPSYFFEVQKDKDGNIIMDGEMQKESLSLPTTVAWEDGKVKKVHVGFLNSFGLLKLYNGELILKGIDDVPTK